MSAWFSLIQLDANAADPIAGGIKFAKFGGSEGIEGDHAWIWRFFGGEPIAKRHFVFRRIEPRINPHTGVRTLAGYYVVSARPPVSPHPAWTVRTKPYDPKLESGSCFSFELRANPVVSRRTDQDRQVRHDVLMDAKTKWAQRQGKERWGLLARAERQLPSMTGNQWLHQKVVEWMQPKEGVGFAGRHGFEVVVDHESEVLRVDSYQRHALGKKGPKASLTTVDLSGVLRVTDTACFRDALLRGAGHGKAYGCGLLLIRRTE